MDSLRRSLLAHAPAISALIERRAVWVVPLLGLLPVAAHPPLEWHWLGWIALAPLLYLLARGPGGSAWWLGAGWGYGLTHFAAHYFWLPESLLEKAGLQFWPFLALTVLGLSLLAGYPALAIALSRLAFLRWRVSPCWTFPVLFAAQDALLGVSPLGGAPWGTAAAAQAGTWAAALAVPLLGGSGLVLLMGAVSAGWAGAFAAALRGGWAGAVGLAAMAGITAVLALPSSAPTAGSEAPGFRALLVPGDLPVSVLADGSRSRETLRYFLSRSLDGLAKAPARGGEGEESPWLVIWPESAVSGRASRGRLLADLFELSVAMDVDFLFGSNAWEGGRVYNSGYLVTGERFRTVRYDKMRRVPFGEYVPIGFRTLFGKKFTAGDDDYAAGQGPPIVVWRGIRLGVAICFESVLTAHLREAVEEGAEAIAVLSNDQWLTPAAARHHLNLTALRGLEVGRDVLFAANGGWSAHLRGGRVLAQSPRDGGAIATEPIRRRHRTPWVRWGYAPLIALSAGYLAVGLLAVPLAGMLIRRSRGGAG